MNFSLLVITKLFIVVLLTMFICRIITLTIETQSLRRAIIIFLAIRIARCLIVENASLIVAVEIINSYFNLERVNS